MSQYQLAGHEFHDSHCENSVFFAIDFVVLPFSLEIVVAAAVVREFMFCCCCCCFCCFGWFLFWSLLLFLLRFLSVFLFLFPKGGKVSLQPSALPLRVNEMFWFWFWL